MQSNVPTKLMAITFLNASRLAADSSVPSLPTVRCAQPIPAEFTNARIGPIDVAISTALTMSLGVGDVHFAECAANFFGKCFAFFGVEVGDDHLGTFFGEHASCGGADATCSSGDYCAGVRKFHSAER